MGNILKTYVRSCQAIGHAFVVQLGRIYLDMLNVYKVMSENIGAAISLNGENVTKQPLVRSMRTVKKEILKLISHWVSRSHDPQLVSFILTCFVCRITCCMIRISHIFNLQVLENFIPHLLDTVLLDYRRTKVPSAREPEVLSTMSTIVSKLTVSIVTFCHCIIRP